jgi:hypothetical protein
MAEQSERDGIDRSQTKSSVSVAHEIVSEDEACIGKGVSSANSDPGKMAIEEKKTKKATGSSMSIGGNEICSEDACIGKD